jgi:hypothetical protein
MFQEFQKKHRCYAITKPGTKCKNRNFSGYSINNHIYCKLHFKTKFCKYIINIITIQKCYRGYRTRRVLKNIYLKLPCEIQTIIKFYISREYYYNKYAKCVNSLLFKRSGTLCEKFEIISAIVLYRSRTVIFNLPNIQEQFNIICDNLDYIEYISRLYYKYKNIQQVSEPIIYFRIKLFAILKTIEKIFTINNNTVQTPKLINVCTTIYNSLEITETFTSIP